MVRESIATERTVAPSQTLDRGLAALSVIAGAPHPLSVNEVAEAIGLHRSITYRLVRTLELHGLVRRDAAGAYLAGSGLAVLARGVRAGFREQARPELQRLADRLGMTAFAVVREGDEAVTVESVSPSTADMHVVYRPGARHPVADGAPGLALLLADAPRGRERAELRAARARGWTRSTGEVLAGMASIAAPVGATGAIAVLWLAAQPANEAVVAREVVRAAHRLAAADGAA